MSTLKFANPIRVGLLAADPSDPENGLLYYNTTSGKFRKYEAGAWSEIAAGDVLDTVFRISDDGDPSKKIAFQASGISASTTRTITMPDSNVDLGLVATAIQSSEKGANNGVATLDAGGKIPSAQIPAIAITSVDVVADDTARDALVVEEGDVAYVTADDKWYIYDGSDWLEITAAGSVSSVNGQTGTVSLDTDDISEGATNKYYTATQARSDLIASSISNGDTTHAPSGDAVFDALALKLANVVEDTSPTLGGDLDMDGKALMATMRRSSTGDAANYVAEEYIHSTALSASQTDTVLAALGFAHAQWEGIEITYKIKEATTARVRIGSLRIVTNGTDVAVVDDYAETADVGVSWSAVINGANVDVRYSSTANAKTLRADVKRIKP